MNRPQSSAEPALPLTSASKHATTPEALRACHRSNDAAVRHMHSVYERLCGVAVRLRMDHIFAWNEWLCAGYDERASALKELVGASRG